MLLFQNCQKSDFLVVTGVVRDSITNKPIEGAYVSINGKWLLSKADGTFTTGNMRPGKVNIGAGYREGYYYKSQSAIISDGRINMINIDLRPIPEPEIITGAITNIKKYSATASGRLNLKGGIYAEQYGLCWSNSDARPTIDNNTGFVTFNYGTGNQSFNTNLTGLLAETIYYVRSYLKTSSGTIIYGKTVAFVTSERDIDDGLIYYFPFDGNGSDISGNGHDLSPEMGTPGYTTDRFGNVNKACHFSSGKWYDSGTPALSDFTVSLWFRKNNFWENSEEHLFQIGDSYSGENNDNRFYMTQGVNPNFFNAGFKIGGTFGSDYKLSLGSYPSLNEWHHALAQRKGSTFYFYIDGVLVNSMSCPSDILPSSHWFNVGGAWIAGGAYQQYHGDLDDLRLYGRALSDVEITYLSTH